MLGQVIDLLFLMAAAALAVMAYKLGSRRSDEVGSCDALADKARQNTIDDSKTRQNAIVGAVSGDDPAGKRAELGNERRA